MLANLVCYFMKNICKKIKRGVGMGGGAVGVVHTSTYTHMYRKGDTQKRYRGTVNHKIFNVRK